jgi:hypothetical protein
MGATLPHISTAHNCIEMDLKIVSGFQARKLIFRIHLDTCIVPDRYTVVGYPH